MKFFNISWLKFVILSAIYISSINFKLFDYIYTNLSANDNSLMIILYVIIYFCLLVGIFSLLFLPYLSKFFAILFVSVSSFSGYFMLNYGVIIDHDMIRNAVQTDKKEVLDLLNVNMFLYIFATCVLPIFFIIKFKINYGTFKKHLIIKFSTLFISLVIAFGLFAIFSKTIMPFLRTYNQARVYNTPFYQIYSALKYAKLEILPKKEFKKISLDANLSTKEKKLMILVVGETARTANFSLAGYKNNDTNFYTKNKNVTFFNNISSCGTATAVSLPCMFSISKKDEFSNSEFQENILDVLQRVGVSVSWFDNNSGGCKGVCDRLNNVKLFSNKYDGFLIDEVKNQLKNLKDQNVIVLHLQGSHGPTYYKRYPDEFKKFNPTCDTNELQKCTQEELYNTYDNTILYTDFIISKLIDLLKNEKNYQSLLLYISDHGENLGENGVYLHGMPYFIAPKEQTNIPMMIWSNDKQINQIALEKKEKNLSHDNLFSTLLGFFNVSTKDYEKNYDILKK